MADADLTGAEMRDSGAIEKRSYPEGHETSAVLRCKSHRSTYIHTCDLQVIRSRFDFLRALHLI